MITTNKKFIKEITAILNASKKAKVLAQSELDAIDAKYKALADKEKAELNSTMKNLDSQIALYDSMLNIPETIPEEKLESETEQVNEDEEPVVEDTIYPDNNLDDPFDNESDNIPSDSFNELSETKLAEFDTEASTQNNDFSENEKSDNFEDAAADTSFDATIVDDGFPSQPEEWA